MRNIKKEKDSFSNKKNNFLLPTSYFLLIYALLFLSCVPPSERGPLEMTWNIPDIIQDNSKIGDSRQFWAQKLTNNSFYRLGATLVSKGEHCNVWVESTNINSTTAQYARNIADAYDEMYDKLLEYFGNEFIVNRNKYNTMQIADFMGDQNGKLTILLLDIDDGWIEGSGGAYVAGYFSQINFYDDTPGWPTNKSDMIYVDINPGTPGSSESINIVAHEMQHLMNFVTREILRIENGVSTQMDLWVNEGLSGAAEWVISGHNELRIFDYNNPRSGLIEKGNNFFVWDNHRYNELAILDDYSTVYLFFQWLRIHNDEKIYKEIIHSFYSDYRAVTENAEGYGINDWDKLLGDWLKANYENSPTGIYGYNGEIILKKHYIISMDIKITSLFPGEGVFSYLPDNTPDDSYPIKYLNLGDALLTYNANTSNRGGAATGIITGNPPVLPNSSIAGSEARSIFINPSDFYPISAGEMLRRNTGIDFEKHTWIFYE